MFLPLESNMYYTNSHVGLTCFGKYQWECNLKREEHDDIGQNSIIKIYHWKVISNFIEFT